MSFASRNSGFNNTPERRADQLCKLLFGYAFISLPPLGQSHYFLHPTFFLSLFYFIPFDFHAPRRLEGRREREMMIFLIILILKIIRRSKNFIYNQLYSRKQDFLTLPLSLELSFIFLRLRFHVYEHL